MMLSQMENCWFWSPGHFPISCASMCLLRPFDTASSFFDISSIPLVTMTTIENTPASARRVFNLAPTMTSEDALKEMHAKTAGSTLANKTTLQSIIVVVMSYERICSTARVVAAAAGIAYLPHLLLQYQALIDRVSHAASRGGTACPYGPLRRTSRGGCWRPWEFVWRFYFGQTLE